LKVFGNYARFYDFIYKEKDYEKECDFLEILFSRYASSSIKDILDLGCGTGGHALLLSQRGYSVVGIDLSDEMLTEARRKSNEYSLKFLKRDIRSLDLGRTFDAVISMFAVISYMTSNHDLISSFRRARKHLNHGGLFIFDVWFGPAVLTNRPGDRFKIVDVGEERIIRLAHSELDIISNIVNVHYKMLRISGKKVVDEVDEVHSVRFLFPQELTYYLEVAGFELRALFPFLHPDETMNENDWNVTVVSIAK